MSKKADRLKAALRENLKRRKAHMRDRTVAKATIVKADDENTPSEKEAEKS